MVFEQEENNPSTIAIEHHEEPFDAQNIWGGDESEWENWRKAKRYMKQGEYMDLQVAEMYSLKTRKAFESVYGSLPDLYEEDLKKISKTTSNLIGEFFISNNGAKYFKRRYFQFLKGEEAAINTYYGNNLFDKETARNARIS